MKKSSMGRKAPFKSSKKFEYSITYSFYDEESLEMGESFDSGYEVEPQVESISEILYTAWGKYGIYYPVSIGTWEATDVPEDRDFYEKGIRKYYVLHLKNEDGTEISEEDNDFVTHILSNGEYNRDYFEEFALGGFLSGSTNEGLSWKLDRAKFNKGESYEIPMSRRKAMGGDADERELIQLRINNLKSLVNVMSDDEEIAQMQGVIARLERERDAMKYAGGGEIEWNYWKIEKDDEIIYERTNVASPNIPNGKRISKEEYDYNVKKSYKTGGEVYFNGMSKKEILDATVVFDNNGDTLDRYTVFTPDGSVFGMSENASGFNQYIGEDDEVEQGEHLGRKLKSVPKNIQSAVLIRMIEEYKEGGGIDDKRNINLHDSVLYKGETWYFTEKNGVKGISNYSQGAWGTNFPFIPVSKINPSDVTDMMGRSVVFKYDDGGEADENDAIEKLWNGYASAILFAEMDSDTEEPLDENYSISDFDEETVKSSKNLMRKFYVENKNAIEKSGIDLDTIGNDIWYTRAGHGAGFFDHKIDKEIENKLTKGAEALGKFPSVETYDGKISVRDGRVFDEYAKGGKLIKSTLRANNSSLIKSANFKDGSHINLLRLNKPYKSGETHAVSDSSIESGQKVRIFQTLEDAELFFDITSDNKSKIVELREPVKRTQNYALGGVTESMKEEIFNKYGLKVSGRSVTTNNKSTADELAEKYHGYVEEDGSKYRVNFDVEFHYGTAYAEGGGVEGHKHVLHIDGQNWFLEKIDSTHFYMSNDRNYRGMAHHIGQHKGEPYYEEVREWLKSTYADGGSMYKDGGIAYKDAVAEFNDELREHSSIKKLAENYNKTPIEVVKHLQPRIKTKGNRAGKTVEVSIDFTDTNTNINTKHVKKFGDGGSMYAEGGEVEEWMNDALKELRDYTDNNSLKIEDVYDDDYFLASDGSEEYLVFEDFDEAHEYAVEDVKSNLESNAEYFQRDWLMGHLEAGNYLRNVYDEWNMGYATDIMTEDDDKYPNRLIAEMVEWGIMDSDEAKGSDAEEIANDRMEDFVNALTDDQINQGNDGFDYYIDNFGEDEAFKMALENNLIDIEGASEDAVSVDGVAHFISSYDGEEIALDGGSYAYRIN